MAPVPAAITILVAAGVLTDLVRITPLTANWVRSLIIKHMPCRCNHSQKAKHHTCYHTRYHTHT